MTLQNIQEVCTYTIQRLVCRRSNRCSRLPINSVWDYPVRLASRIGTARPQADRHAYSDLRSHGAFGCVPLSLSAILLISALIHSHRFMSEARHVVAWITTADRSMLEAAGTPCVAGSLEL